jgi:Domain of unknown function (DUF4115)
MAKRSSVRSKENSPDLTPIPEDKSGSKKKPYIFTRAFARLLNLDQEQAVAGYLASTRPGEPNPTLPEPAAPPPASAPSDSNPGRPIIPKGVEVRKLETPNPNIKLPPGRVTESTPGKSDRAAILSNPNAPSNPSARPITPNGVHIRKVTEISKSLNTKSPSGRVTESAPARGKSDAASIPEVKAPSDPGAGRPIAQKEPKTHKAMEMPSPANLTLLLLGAARARARVTESAPTQGEVGQASSLTKTNAASDSSTTRPITQDGVEIRKGREIRSPANVKRPASPQIQAKVVESAPARGESGRASSLPKAKTASDSSITRPITQDGVEIRKGTEIPSPANTKLSPSAQIQPRVVEPAPEQVESGRASGLPKAKTASDKTGQPITPDGVEVRKGTESTSPTSTKFPSSEQIQARVVELPPTEGEGGRTSSLPKTSAASDSSTTRPITPDGVEIREGTESPSPTSTKLPPSAQIQARVVELPPAEGEDRRTSSLPKTNAASNWSITRPVTPDGVEIRKGTEIPSPTGIKLPPSPQIQARVAESAPAQGEGGQTSTVPNANAPVDSNTGRAIIQNRVEIRNFVEVSKQDINFPAEELAESTPVEESGPASTVPNANAPSDSSTGQPIIQSRVEIRKFVEVPDPNIKFRAGELAESSPVEQSGRASPVPNANAPSDSSTGQPIVQNRVEIRKFVEVPNPNIKFRAGALAESAPVEESGRANAVPSANPPSDSSAGRPILQNRVEIRKFVEVPNPNIKLAAGELTESAPSQGESSRATNLPKTNESSPTRTSTQERVEVRKVTIPNLAKMKVPPGAQIQERLAILVLVVALGVAVWGFFTRGTDTRVRVSHPVPPDSNSSASVASPDAQMPFSNQAPVSSASRGMASFVVGIKARKNVWVSIRADGKKLSEEKLTSGAEKSVTAANQVMVKTGNPSALDFEFNGKKLPSQATSGDVQTFEFGPSGLEVVISQPSTRMKPGK